MQTLRDRLQAGSDDPLHLVKGRVHEVEGRGRTGFALYQAARLAGPIFWIVLAHDRDRPMPGSLTDGVAERLHFIEARDESALDRRRSATGAASVLGHRRSRETNLTDRGPAAPAGSRGRRDHGPDADPGGQGKQCRRDPLEM